MFVWGPIGKVQFISKHDFSPGYQRTALFVESTGCLKSGNPKQGQQLYKIREFWLKKGNKPQPSTNVKVEVVPKQEKEKILKQAVLDAQKENAYFSNFGTGSNGLIQTTSQLCLTVEEWRTGKVE